MGMFDNFKNSPMNPLYMFDRDDAAGDANKYMDQIPDVGKKYNNPFIERGKRAGEDLEGQYGQMRDPTSFMDSIMDKYKMSKGAEYKRDQLGRGINATAAAGGYAGTEGNQRDNAQMSNDVMSGDMQQYLQNALGIYDKGVAGEQGFFDKGFDASGRQQDLEGGTLSSQAGLAFKAGTDRNADRSALMNALLKALGQGAGAAAGA